MRIPRLLPLAPDHIPAPDASRAELERAEAETPLVTLLRQLVDTRTAAMTVGEAVKMPPVRRAVDLIVSVGAQFRPLVWAGGAPAPTQPLAVTRPDPSITLYAFVVQAISSLLFDGELILQRLGSGARVLPPEEVEVVWDDRRMGRSYSWRGTELPRSTLVHAMIDGRAGRLRGSSPLRECVSYLSPVKAAEDYALTFFSAGGLPAVVLKVAASMDEEEADRLKARWIDSRVGPDPAILSGGVDADFPSVDPESAQMQETRAYGATIVARMLGIPAPLLHVETTGSTITYTNTDGAIAALVKSTVYPLYLRPIEDALESLMGAPARFVTDAGVPVGGALFADGIGPAPIPAREDRESD